MIVFKHGDIFDTDCDTIVNTVNCVGVMGKGIALECKRRYSALFKEYQQACKKVLTHGGDLYFWHNSMIKATLFGVPVHTDTRNILNFATKEHWKNPSRIEWIERGLRTFTSVCDSESDKGKWWEGLYWYELFKIQSIAFPKLGCSNGGLDWEEVKPLMIKYLNDIPLYCEVYE